MGGIRFCVGGGEGEDPAGFLVSSELKKLDRTLSDGGGVFVVFPSSSNTWDRGLVEGERERERERERDI